jgi:hypothetical protein
MLQHVWSLLPAAEVGEHAYLLHEIGLKATPDAAGPLDDRVLEEGYSATRLAPFITEFRRRLARRDSLHADLRRRSPSAESWRVFFQLGREECAIELARYLFSPREVVDRIVASLRVSEGETPPGCPPLIRREAEAALSRWPRFEREIAAGLAAGRTIYWAGEAPDARLNALVSSPPGTVVVVIKPPGSRLEIEIKRTGRRARRPLAVVYERSGKPVPRSHRLDGGSMSRSLEFEAAASARLSEVFRLVWGSPAPIPLTLSSRRVDTVAVDGRVEDVVDYFTEKRVFDTGFAAMRVAMARSVEAFEREGDAGLPDLEGELGLTARFLHHASPGQSILIGTTMFRLEWLARFLGETGAESAPAADERRAVDVLLEEMLGLFRPPRGEFRGRARYLEAVLAEPRNRARADRVFLSMMRQLGRFWGTLLGMRAYSNGESLVARNVGLTSVWARGRWRPTLVFMDHDDLHIPAPDDPFRPRAMLAGTRGDKNYAIGDPSICHRPFSLVDHLRLIYRVGPDVASAGDEVLRQTLAVAFCRTRRIIAIHSRTTGLFSRRFVEETRVWDRMVSTRLARQLGGETGGGPIRSRRGCSIPDGLRLRFENLIEFNINLIIMIYSGIVSLDSPIEEPTSNPSDVEEPP